LRADCCGLFGGTFNPIHWGHLVIAEEVREAFGLSTVLFVPAGCPPHKPEMPLAPASDRLRMVSLAVEGNPAFDVSSIELDREGPSYTVHTLEALRRERPRTAWLLIVGSDAFAEIGTWHRSEDLLALCGIVVIERPGAPVAAAVAAAPGEFRDAVAEMPGPGGEVTGMVFPRRTAAIGVSSTGIRGRVAAGRSIRYLVPEKVMEYISIRKLYEEGR
jgi:nicotinate-nucleotide adenylyltransferase